jgi:hypothetical protein
MIGHGRKGDFVGKHKTAPEEWGLALIVISFLADFFGKLWFEGVICPIQRVASALS